MLLDSVRKSIGAEVNWGVRFQEEPQVIRFLSEIVDEVVSRMKAAGYLGLRVIVKAKKAKPGVTPMKHGGHGPCFNVSKFVSLFFFFFLERGRGTKDSPYCRSSFLPQFTQHAPTILLIAKDLYRQLSIPPPELRGLGVHLSQLRSESEGADDGALAPRQEVRNRALGEEENSGGQKSLMKWATKDKMAQKAEVDEKEDVTEFEGRLSVSQVFRPKGVFQHPRRAPSRKEWQEAKNEKMEVEDGVSLDEEISLPENLSQIDLDVVESLPSPLRRKIEMELRNKKGGGGSVSSTVKGLGGEERRRGGDLPNLSQVDLSVVDSLPLPLRREIEAEYRQRLGQQRGKGQGKGGFNDPKRQRTLGEIGCCVEGEGEEERRKEKDNQEVKKSQPSLPKEGEGGNLTTFLLSSKNPKGPPPSTSCTAPVLFFHSEEVDVEFRKRVKKWMSTTLHPSPLQKAMLLLFAEQLALEGSLEGLEFLIKFLVSFAKEYSQWGGVVGGVVGEVQEVVCGLYGCCLDVEIPEEWKEEG